jgi:hypothetical protein
MRTIEYDDKETSDTGSTETHIATDEAMNKKFGNMQRALEEGFAASNGVRGGTAESDGRVKHPEKSDYSRPNRVTNSIEDENPGLADN